MMESLVSLQNKSKNVHAPGQKFLSVGAQKDLWIVVREGSLADVESALALLKKNGGNINSRNVFGLTPLHIATWRNHIPVVRRLLAAGADPDIRDGESGWGSLHRALHFGHLAVASILLQFGASITLEDSKSRTPVDLLSGPVLQVLGDGSNSVATEVSTWGNGANYQLGTGNAHIQKLPCKVDALLGSSVKLVSAAKFHSVAVSSRGEVYTWGFGRGGRLGHPDFDIHSGQAAVITPRQVTSGLGSRRVKAIAAAKHHTVLATEGGEVFTWGSNREGQLGYTVDTQPTPRRVSALRSRIIAVAAANKHTAVVSDSGECFTWGCNKEGQLGYGTSNSASNYTPRVVEYLKNKVLCGVAAAKYHTLVLGADGEVYTWGHRLVTPKRVIVARNLKKSGCFPLKFHRMERLHVSAVAAGMVHSLALTDDGALFYWMSADPDLKCQQLYSLCGKNVLNISAGKYWSSVVTTTGDIFTWDAKKIMDKPPVVTRLHGVKRATSVAVGETHMIMVSSIYHPILPTSMTHSSKKEELLVRDEGEELDEGLLFRDVESPTTSDCPGKKPVPSLKFLCEKVAMENIVEPRNAIQMLEIADSLDADELRRHCEDIAIHNLDYILTVASHTFSSASPEILVTLENLLDKRSSEPWSYRRLPTPTATLPVIINSEEEDSESEVLRTRDNHPAKLVMRVNQRLDSFLQPEDDANQGISKQVRALRKKLQQIEMLEEKQYSGRQLDDQQLAKLQTRSEIETSLADLGFPVGTVQAKASVSPSPDARGSKKPDASKKHRRKGRQQKTSQLEVASEADTHSVPVKSSLYLEIPDSPLDKEEEAAGIKPCSEKPVSEEFSSGASKKDTLEPPKAKITSPAVSKKKNRKGGLSMFLSGALDETPKEIIAPAPPTPKSEGPAWGGAKLSKDVAASLREILDEQGKTTVGLPAKKKDLGEHHVVDRSEGKILLSSFLASKPIPVVSGNASLPSDAEINTPPWASGTPPLPSRPSLRDIQMQQVKKHQSLSHSPKTKTSGFTVAGGPASPSDSSSGMNRWFKPEIDTPSSLRAIQIEEKAMKDLKRFYSSVKIVKNAT